MTIKDTKDWVESNERTIEINGLTHESYGHPRSYYKVAHFTDTILLQLSFNALRLWHYSLSRLSSAPAMEQCVIVILTSDAVKDYMSRNYFFKAKKELLRFRLLLKTKGRNKYVVNIQYAHKLNAPKTYSHKKIKKQKVISLKQEDNLKDKDDRSLYL